MLFLLALGVLISFLDRTSIGSAIADKTFVKEFALSNVGRGWINSAFSGPMALLRSPWAGWWIAMA
jgi:hypothetical protein